MEKKLYIIEYESAHWCGGASHCVVWALSEDEARSEADLHMDEEMRELFSSEHEELEECDDQGPSYSVNWVKLLEGSDYEEYYENEQQRRNFFPCVNKK